MKIKKLLLGLLFAVPAAVGVGTFNKPVKKADVAEAGSASKSRIVFELEDQCYSTNDSRDPILHIWNISVDSSMGYDTTNLTDEMIAAGVANDLQGGGANVKQINSDGSIDTGFTWIDWSGSYRLWYVELPWYITGFTYKIHCGSYWSKYENTVSSRGSYKIYQWGSWDSYQSDLGASGSSSRSNTYTVTNYTITATPSGGAGNCDAQIKGNGGDWCHSGQFFARQKLELKATAGTYSSFDHWTKGNNVVVSNDYDYVGTSVEAYIGHFLDLRTTHTIVFKDEDGTPLETLTDVYQGSSVSASSTPTKADEGSKQFTFSKWVDDSGNDMTDDLADVQDDLVVFASYSISYKSGFYIYGDFGTSPSWNVETAYLMTQFSESSYAYSVKATVDIPYGSVFKVIYYEGSFDYGQEFGTANVQTDSPALYCYDCSRNDHAFQCYAGGRYTIILHNFELQGKSIYINFENSSRNAEQLAAYVMKFGANPESGHCGDNDRFPAARTMYLDNLSASEKTKFQGFASSSTAQYKNGYDRYVAWAAALGQNPWASGAAVSARLLGSITSQDSSSILIIVVISLVSVSTIGGFFFIKKRKETN